ncbi:MAG: putative glycolipid-binding domain-containing protein [Planctomycetes bacterium]|nr:putative glycolipid-binding domain-containing protein [Planctomycetota bacterium]
MRPLLLAFTLLLASCSGDENAGPKAEYGKGPFRPVRVTFWQDPENAASGHLTERRLADGSVIAREHCVGLDPLATQDPAFWADLAVESDSTGKVARVLVTAGVGEEAASNPLRLELTRAAGGRWSRSRPGGGWDELPALDGCDDVEIPAAHATASLPVRRLALRAGESKDLDRVLVRVPQLDVERVRRRLTRLDETMYAWEGLGKDGTSAWRVELRADGTGAVLEQSAEGLHRRVVRDTTIE